MNRIRLALVVFVLCCLQGPAGQAQRVLTEDFQLYDKVGSAFRPKTRQIIVWKPPGYNSEPARRYPVLYLHDGGVVFAQWRIDETAKRLIGSREIEPLLIVMVNNTGTQEDRFDEYTPTRSAQFRNGGKADDYGRMLVEEIKPFVDTEYRTLSDASNTGLGGVSLGGLVSLYLGLKHPNVFGKLAVMSPSVWWDDKTIVRRVKKLAAKPALHIWLNIGTEEGTRSIDDVRDLRDALVKTGWVLNSDLKYFEAKGGRHNEESFAQRAEPMLKYLFPKQSN